MWPIIETFRRYGLPTIGGGALVAGLFELGNSVLQSLTSVDQSAARYHEDLSCYLGILAIVCGAGYFGLRRPTVSIDNEPIKPPF